jgi:elongation factor P hydroxylase
LINSQLNNNAHMHDNTFVHNAVDLEHLFKTCFFARYQTVLKGGFDEPLYQPAGSKSDLRTPQLNIICYRHDYYSSALHEISHWCIAGKERRTQVDYGYWYAPDGRTSEQQAKFEKAEIKPQAIEWGFSAAANLPFRVSIDNLVAANDGQAAFGEQVFTQKVRSQLMTYIQHGFPARAQQYIQALHQFYNTPSLRSQFK